MNIFKRERKPDELVTKACTAFEELSGPKGATVRPFSPGILSCTACLEGGTTDLRPALVSLQANENLSRYLKEMKVWLYGEPGEQSAKEDTIPVGPGAYCRMVLVRSRWLTPGFVAHRRS